MSTNPPFSFANLWVSCYLSLSVTLVRGWKKAEFSPFARGTSETEKQSHVHQPQSRTIAPFPLKRSILVWLSPLSFITTYNTHTMFMVFLALYTEGLYLSSTFTNKGKSYGYSIYISHDFASLRIAFYLLSRYMLFTVFVYKILCPSRPGVWWLMWIFCLLFLVKASWSFVFEGIT